MKICNRGSAADRAYRGDGWYSALLPARVVLSCIYRFIIALRKFYYKVSTGGCEPPAGVRVISVGNIVAGGGGKTPCSITLAEGLAERGRAPVIVTRGYGSSAEKAGKPVILSDNIPPGRSGDYLTKEDFNVGSGPGIEFASRFGDEVALYRSRGIPVVIDPDRNRGIAASASVLNADYTILDDGFQNLSAHRDFNLLLLDHSAPFADGRLIPWGRLREGPGSAERADAVIFTRSRSNRIPDQAEGAVAGKRVFFSRHEFLSILDRERKQIEAANLKGKSLAIFSGIAVPENFESMVGENIAEPSVSFRYSDHHRYKPDDVRYMIEKAGDSAVFLTTGKDWFKSAELFPSDTDIYMVDMEMSIDRGEDLLEYIDPS